MGKFDGIIFCSDVDGTLVNGSDPVSEGNTEAIKYFQDNGGIFTACTGRHPIIVNTVLKNIKLNAPIIGYNGAIVYDWEIPAEIRVLNLPKAIVADCIRFMDNEPEIIDLVLSTWSDSIFLAADKKAGGYISPCRTFNGRHFDAADEFINSLPDEVIYKVLFRLNDNISPEDSERIRDAAIHIFSGYDVTRSWIRGVEVNFPGAAKGSSARFVADMMGKRYLVCAGDYENDLSMIREADLGFAMENGIDSLKSEANVIAPHCAHDGIKWIIEYLEKEIDEGGLRL